MLNYNMNKILTLLCATLAGFSATAQKNLSLNTPRLQLNWQQQNDGWHLTALRAGGKTMAHPSGAFTILYVNRPPAANLVDQDLEGKDFSFYPEQAEQKADGSLFFKQKLRIGEVTSTWRADPANPSDIRVEVKLKATNKGWFAIASPTLAAIDNEDMTWGMVPGNWYGTEMQPDFRLSTLYSQGVPSFPYLAKERNTMTLCPLVSTRNGLTLAVIPDPGTAADPWEKDHNTKGANKLAMSTRNRHNELTPVAYAPVLGQAGSQLDAGAEVVFRFRYSLQDAPWWTVYRHAVSDIYHFADMLDIQQEKRSLSERVRLMQNYLQDDKKSNWTELKSRGYEIGANGSKNADIGALLMLATAGQDPAQNKHYPFVRNYKLAQQETAPGFFQGSCMGEYADQDGVESERGNYVEPLFTTYYTLMDMGNMLLFHPEDQELKKRVRLAADRLLAWQHTDGGFVVAYDRFSRQETFPDLKDFRPTWYGLLIAYRTLGDPKYLTAARKGADWLIKNGVDKGYFLGVCGDARNLWDFATAQCAQALLDLHTLTKDEKYQQAAIRTAKIYATSIFTQPMATNAPKKAGGKDLQDWEVSQTGLSVEHIRGTANEGPILISSFAGMFVRLHELTKDPLFLTMARCAARGRDAFVDAENGQSIYYWNGMNDVVQNAKSFPHHAFWQIGWITDYLLSEANLRSGGKISFPSGFMTPKVGPHVCYGFAPGSVLGTKAALVMPYGLLKSENPWLEYVAALSEKKDKLFVLVLNQSPQAQSGSVSVDPGTLPGSPKGYGQTVLQGEALTGKQAGQLQVNLNPWGLSVIAIDLK